MPITPQMPDDVGAGGYDDTEARQKAQDAAAAASAKAQQEDLERAIESRISRLTIAGPGVSGSARTGWAINTPATSAGSEESEETEDYYVVINGTLYTQAFVVSGPPIAV